MRRLIVVSLLLLIIISVVFCDGGDVSTANSSLVFSAYKNPELPPLRYTITISNNYDTDITGTTQEYGLNNYNQTLNNALTVKISTNLKNDIAVELWFYPFINEYDPTDFFTATYTTSNSRMSTNTVTCEYNSVDYRYKGKWTLSGFTTSGSNYSIKPLTASGIRGVITSKITSEKKKNGSWVNNTDIPSQNGVIRGLTEDQFIENSISFSMNIYFGSPARTPEANMKYVARVRLVISSV